MGNRIAAIDPLSDNRWDDFVQSHPKSSVYHHSAWINLIASTFPYRPCCYAFIEKKSDCLKGLVPFMVSSGLFKRGRLVSLPYATYCDPLVPNGRFEEILACAIHNHRGSPRIELKLTSNLAELPQTFERENSFVTHTVDLSGDMDVLFGKFHNSCVRRKIKKAQRSGLLFHFSDCEKDIKKVYDLLLSMRKTKGLPPQPYKFFLNMWKILGPLNMFFAPYVTYQDKIISVAIVLKFKDTIYYEYGASDPTYQNLGSNQFLLWEVMKFGHEMSAHTFDLGRSHFENHNLLIFKDRLGGKRTALTYYYFPKRPVAKSMSEAMMSFGGSLNKLLPNQLLRLEGELIYRFFR